jgi:hypothetical protein
MTTAEAIRNHHHFELYLKHYRSVGLLQCIAEDIARTHGGSMRSIKQAIRNAAVRSAKIGRPRTKPDVECTVACAHCGRENIITIGRST